MKKKLLLMFLIGLFLIPNVVSAYEMKFDWEVSYKDQGYNYFRYVLILEDGSSVVLYDTSNKYYSTDDYQAFIKYDKDGKQVWFKKIDKSIEIEQMISNNNGGFIVVGTTSLAKIGEKDNNGKNDAIILNYDKDGNVVWQNNYGTVENDYFYFVDYDNKDEEFAAFGSKNSLDGNGVVVRFDKNGNYLLDIDVDLDFLDSNYNYRYYFHSFNLLSDDSFVIASSRSRRDVEDVAWEEILVKYDKNGEHQWNKCEYSYSDVHHSINDVLIDENNNILTIGRNWCDNNDTYSFFRKYDTVGNLISEHKYSYINLVNRYDLIRLYNNNGQYCLLAETSILFFDKDLKLVKEKSIEVLTDYSISDIFYDIKRNSLFFKGVKGKDFELERLIKYAPEYMIDVLETQNGSVSALQVDDLGNIVTKPDDKYKVDKIIVKDSLGKEVAVKADKVNEYSFELYDDVTVEVIFKKEYKITINETVNGKATAEQYENGKGRVNAVADEGFELDNMVIKDTTGKEVVYEEKDGYYYFDVNDDLVITVTFKELPKEVVKGDEENPKTADAFIYYACAVVCSLFGIWSVEQYRKTGKQ